MSIKLSPESVVGFFCLATKARLSPEDRQTMADLIKVAYEEGARNRAAEEVSVDTNEAYKRGWDDRDRRASQECQQEYQSGWDDCERKLRIDSEKVRKPSGAELNEAYNHGWDDRDRRAGKENVEAYKRGWDECERALLDDDGEKMRKVADAELNKAYDSGYADGQKALE